MTKLLTQIGYFWKIEKGKNNAGGFNVTVLLMSKAQDLIISKTKITGPGHFWFEK